MDKTLFNEALVSLVEFASANGNHVSKKDVETYFSNIISDKDMYNAIFSYLKESKITVDDLNENEIAPLTEIDSTNDAVNEPALESEEENAFIELYQNDLSNISPLTKDEKEKLIDELKNGSSDALAKLTEDSLVKVKEIALTFKGNGLSLGDLIQEGNMGLIIGLSQFDGDSADYDSFMENCIRSSIEDAINTQINSVRVSSHLANRMNNLDDLSRDLTEKLGHAPSIKELAEEMNISEEEVDTIIRTSLNVLSVNQAEDDIDDK